MSSFEGGGGLLATSAGAAKTEEREQRAQSASKTRVTRFLAYIFFVVCVRMCLRGRERKRALRGLMRRRKKKRKLRTQGTYLCNFSSLPKANSWRVIDMNALSVGVCAQKKDLCYF